MKKSLFLLTVIVVCIFPVSSSMSCNSVEGNIENSPIDLTFVKTSYASDSFESPLKKSDSVLICNSKSAYAFHNNYCSGLNRCKASVSRILKSDAEAQGYRACKFCY